MSAFVGSIKAFYSRFKAARFLGKSFRSRDRGDFTSAIYYLEKVLTLNEKYPDDLTYQIATEELFGHYMRQNNFENAIDRGLLSLQILMKSEDYNLRIFEKQRYSKASFLYALYSALAQHNPEHPKIDLLKTIISKYETSTN